MEQNYFFANIESLRSPEAREILALSALTPDSLVDSLGRSTYPVLAPERSVGISSDLVNITTGLARSLAPVADKYQNAFCESEGCLAVICAYLLFGGVFLTYRKTLHDCVPTAMLAVNPGQSNIIRSSIVTCGSKWGVGCAVGRLLPQSQLVWDMLNARDARRSLATMDSRREFMGEGQFVQNLRSLRALHIRNDWLVERPGISFPVLAPDARALILSSTPLVVRETAAWLDKVKTDLLDYYAGRTDNFLNVSLPNFLDMIFHCLCHNLIGDWLQLGIIPVPSASAVSQSLPGR